MNGATERLQSLAATVASWPDPPRHAQVLAALDVLDVIALQMGRLIIPDEPPQSLHQCARALYSMSAQSPPDVAAATAAVRVATRCIAAAHRAANRFKEPKR